MKNHIEAVDSIIGTTRHTSRAANGESLAAEGGTMRKNEKSMLWVVYRMTIHGKPSQMIAVCEQCDWDAMELAKPGHHTLIQAGITSEGEAERVARGTVCEQAIIKTPKAPTRLALTVIQGE
jgi:hypothetical protein